MKWGLGGRITPRGHMLMWLLVGVLTAALPLGDLLPDADWSLRSYLPQVTDAYEFTAQRPSYPEGGLENVQEYGIDTARKQISTGQVITRSTGSSLESVMKLKTAAEIIWMAGTGAGAGLFLLAACRQRRKLNGLADCMDTAVLRVFNLVCTELDLHRKICLKTGADATMLAGLRQLTVYLAADCVFTEAELHHVFAHELTHYKHRDLWLNVIAAGFLCVFWWNPVFWFAFRRFRLDMEVYCDYDAVKVTGDRQAYAKTLVKAASGQKRLAMMATSLVEEENQVSRRVKALAKFKKPKIWVSVLAAAILLGVCVGLTVNPAEGEALLAEKNVEFLNLYMRNSHGETVSLNLDEQKESFLQAVNRNRGSWSRCQDEEGPEVNAKTMTQLYMSNMAEPTATFSFQSLQELISSHYIPGENTVKLYARDFTRRGTVVLELKGGKRYITTSQEVWDGLVDIIAEVTVMRDVAFETASKEANTDLCVNEDGSLKDGLKRY